MDTDDCETVLQITDSDFYRTLVEHASVGILTLDSANRIVDANAALAGLLGYMPEELVGEQLWSIVPERTRPLDATTALAASDERADETELSLVHRDGTTVPVIVRVDADEYRGERVRTAFVCPRSDPTEGAHGSTSDRDDDIDVDRLFRTVAAAILESSTREAIEQTVCDRLAESPAYEFAWIAEVDQMTDEVTPRATAGAEDYLAAIDLTTDPDEPIGRGPGGKTFRTGASHVSQDVFEDPSFEPWHEDADRFGFRSVAIVPISTESTVYGAIGIYSARVGAFGETERTMVEQLGRLVGDAIASAEQRQALLADAIVELEFRIRDVFESFDRSLVTDGTITLEHVIALDDESFLAYGTATGESVTVVEALADDDAVECVESVTRRDETGDSSHIEVRLCDPPLLTTLTAYGATLETVRLADGDLTMQIGAVPSTGVQPVVDAVTTSCPGVEMVSRHQRPQITRTPEQIRRSLTDRLTARQQTALEAAYNAGFFEWPREHSGEEVAASLEINSSTFHQHVRKAENELLDVLCDGD